jgi:bacteriocin biosynthesis cyclodehydratase domain-containing protein
MFRVQGRSVPVLVDHLLPLVDGARSVGAIQEHLADRIAARPLAELLEALVRHGLLRDVSEAPALSDAERAEHREILALLSRFSERPEALLAGLRAARVLVVCDSPWGADVAGALRESAVGTVRWLESGEALEAEVAAATLVVGLQDGDFTGAALLAALNRACVALGRGLLHARLTLDAEGFLGPLYEPGGACLECLRLRIRNNLQAGREVGLAERRVEQGQLAVERLAYAPFRRQLAAMVALEVVKQLTAVEPSALYCRCRIVDLMTHESQLHTVLRHPACGACGQRQEGRVYPWDEDEIRVERMLIPAELP